MPESESGISTTQARAALIVLLLVDAGSFISLDSDAGGLTLSLAGSWSAWTLLAIDALLASGLVRARHWALELGRYRCMLGVCLLVFLWLSYFLVLDSTRGVSLNEVVLAGMTRDGLLAALLIVALFLIRRRKQPQIPQPEPAAGDDRGEGDAGGEPSA